MPLTSSFVLLKEVCKSRTFNIHYMVVGMLNAVPRLLVIVKRLLVIALFVDKSITFYHLVLLEIWSSDYFLDWLLSEWDTDPEWRQLSFWAGNSFWELLRFTYRVFQLLSQIFCVKFDMMCMYHSDGSTCITFHYYNYYFASN